MKFTGKKVVVTRSEEETAEFAAKLARTIGPGVVLALRGDLGAGKTVFARGFARGLGWEGPVPSPTFTIVQEYEFNNESSGIRRLHHVDLYRIDGADTALAFGLDERLPDPEGVSLVEWPERAESLFPPSVVEVSIRHLEGDSRELTVSSHSLLDRMERQLFSEP